MLVYVPLSHVALVYAGGALRAVLEAGVGVVPRYAGELLSVDYVDLQLEVEWTRTRATAVEPNWSPQGWETLETLN
jgi:hypothetical protein